MFVFLDIKFFSMVMFLIVSMEEFFTEREEGIFREGIDEVLDYVDIQFNLGEIFIEGVSGVSVCVQCGMGWVFYQWKRWL